MSLTQPPRSVRNNNPGNLETGFEWLGLSKIRTDAPYCVFITPVHGFRALAIDLKTAYSHGFNTVRTLISHFAPPEDNPTEDYVRNVSDAIGLPPDALLNLSDEPQLTAMCRAIAVQEAGGWFFNANDLTNGVRLALDYTNRIPAAERQATASINQNLATETYHGSKCTITGATGHPHPGLRFQS